MSESSKKVILLVEDEDSMAEIISVTLRQNGFDVIIAESGENAIGIVNRGKLIHLILMDIILGDGIDGIEAARIILQDYDIPLIFLSGHTEPEIVKRTESINSYGYVLKQSGETILIASIKMALNLYEARKKIDRHEVLLRKKQWFDNIILESVSDGVLVVSETGKILFVNQTLEHIFGYSSEELIGNQLMMLMPEFLKDKHLAAFNSYVTTGNRRLPCWTGIALPGLHKYGHEIALEVSWKENNSYAQRVFCGIIKDVTERKKAEDTIRNQNEFLNNTINSLAHPFYVINADTYIVEVANKAAHTDLPENICCYELIHHLNSPCGSSEFLCPIEEVKLTRQPVMTEHVHYHSDGGSFYSEVRGYPIFDRNGRVIKVIKYCLDITERRRKDEELRKLTDELEQRVSERTAELHIANIALEKAARHKDEFLASMSHELRTPLTGVLSLSESLQEEVYGPMNDKQRKMLHRIEESGQHLLDLINDILDLSKVESGQMELQIEKASVSDICQSALQLTKGMANKKRHTVSFSMNSGSMSIDADPRRLKQMLVNLLSNAVKFTPEGGKIGLEVEGNETDQTISFSVSDTGIGIEPKMFSMLFKPFVQLDSRLSRQYAGTGLGLSLVQRMAELHGGSVSVDSELGKGSRFTIHLPCTTPIQRESREDTVSDSETPSKARILLVEDNEINSSIYSEYLRKKRYSVAVAKNGREGIKKAGELQPDLILMDIQMPGMDGLEAICILRSDKNSRLASVPIIALTSLEVPGDREQCLASGANEYLSKPVPLDVLLKTIERYLFP